MSTDEQDRVAGAALRELREREQELRIVQCKARKLAERISPVLACLVDGEVSLEKEDAMNHFPPHEEIVQVVNDLQGLSIRIEELKTTLGMA